MMKKLLRSEELAQFLVCLCALVMNDVPWWAYLLLVLGPDIGMMGYLRGPRTGAFFYNILHHKGLAILVAALSFVSEGLNMLLAAPNIAPVLFLGGIILYGHASMDRVFGYGLKFGDHFQHTHLGWIGKAGRKQEESTES